jgi:hypothetical protein
MAAVDNGQEREARFNQRLGGGDIVMSIKSLRFGLALSALLAFGGAAYAETPLQDTHGRRDEVSVRARETARIREQRREQDLRAERARERQHEQHELNQRDHHELTR